MWIEVETAEKENRRELVLTGKGIQGRILDTGLDHNIFKLVNLNFLDISDAGLDCVPDTLGNLNNLTNLVLKGNGLSRLPDSLGSLKKLKLLDVSKNQISILPNIEGLDQLSTLNLSLNKFREFPDIGIEKCCKLATVDLSVNDLTDITVLESAALEHLAELNLSRNEIPRVDGCVKDTWAGIKKLDLADNKLKTLPVELGELSKLKELHLGGNPLVDNRLKKMAAQKSTKSVLEYIRQHGDKGTEEQSDTKGGKKKKKSKNADKAKEKDSVDVLCDRLTVLNVSDGNPEIYTQTPVLAVRPYIVVCFVRNLNLHGENLRKFLQLQTKLHKGVCANRTLATIATHDLAAIKGPLKYTAQDPDSFRMVPLAGGEPILASKFVNSLRAEAEALRKEKKRSQVSGIHLYLPMVEKFAQYPCVVDSEGRIISFPPVTNSGVTRLSAETKDILVEVTAGNKLADAKLVADTLLREMLELGLGDPVDGDDGQTTVRTLTVEQGRVLDEEGSLKVTYPSKADLVFDKPGFSIIRT